MSDHADTMDYESRLPLVFAIRPAYLQARRSPGCLALLFIIEYHNPFGYATKMWDPALGAWQEAEAPKVWNEALEAWEDRWGGKRYLYNMGGECTDVTDGWLFPDFIRTDVQ